MKHKITRRHFLEAGAASTVAGVLAANVGAKAIGDSSGADWSRRVAEEQDRYRDKSLPEIPVPRFEGERYDTEVPDTLELTERAELSIHAITSMLDENRDYLLWTVAWFNRKPPVIQIIYPLNNLSCGHKMLEALPLLRIMGGSSSAIEVDKKLMESMLHMTAKDGVVYMPYLKGSLAPTYPYPVPFLDPFASVPGEGRDILALCMWYQHDKNPLWKTLIEKKIHRLSELMVREGDYGYYARPNAEYFNRSSRPVVDKKGYYWNEVYFTLQDHRPLRDPSGGQGKFSDPMSVHLINFMLSRSLCVYYRLTGYEPALELAGRLIRAARYHRKAFDEDGRWLIYHFHTSSASLLSMLDYATITKDGELLAYVKKAYEYGRVLGDPVVGFFPEYVPGSEMYVARRAINTCETCEVADMAALALKLTLAGVGEYWEDVERWVRNQYVENQLMGLDWLDNLDPAAFKYLTGGWSTQKGVRPWESTDVKRSVGSFAGWSLGNDRGPGSSHMCCTPNAGRTMYWIWDSILTSEGEKVRVNLLLNRASPWLDVDSYLPNEGKVELKIKEAREVAVRIPEWTKPKEVACKVNGKRREPAWAGSYLEVRDLRSGDTVTVEFPVKEQTAVRLIGEFPYRVTLKGNTVVDMSPKGKICPIYQREKYKTDKVAMRKITRFVSREALLW